MSSLENLKKQAKALVRLHRERSHHFSIVARDVLPRFHDRSDRQILDDDFRLADAQELLARQHGCESWRALRSRLEAEGPVTKTVASTPQGLVRAQPMLYVADVPRALSYYEAVLGFERRLVAGDPPFYAEVARDSVVLCLRFVHRPVFDAAARGEEELLWQASIGVVGVKGLYVEVVAAGAQIDTPLRREPWGAWDFAISDPDGNLLGFFEAPA